jgi:predicted RNA-binding protein with PIN domain
MTKKTGKGLANNIKRCQQSRERARSVLTTLLYSYSPFSNMTIIMGFSNVRQGLE